jgi:hypothetical protein
MRRTLPRIWQEGRSSRRPRRRQLANSIAAVLAGGDRGLLGAEDRRNAPAAFLAGLGRGRPDRAFRVPLCVAHPDEHVRDRAMRAGAVSFMSKPISEADLIRCLDRALKNDGLRSPQLGAFCSSLKPSSSHEFVNLFRVQAATAQQRRPTVLSPANGRRCGSGRVRRRGAAGCTAALGVPAPSHRRLWSLRRCRRTPGGENETARLKPPCSGRRHHPENNWVASALGKVKWKAVPKGFRGNAQSLPPCASMIDRQMERPKPIPWDFVVKKGSKMRSR